MADTAEMRFLVQGSAAAPYLLKAYGSGDAFQMFCSCPAGRMARAFCKHIAAVLMGEVERLVHPSDDVLELVKRAYGSALLAQAFHHQPRPIPRTLKLDVDISEGLDKALDGVAAEAQAAGWWVQSDAYQIGLYALSKRGKPLSQPRVAIGIGEESTKRPFYVIAPDGKGGHFGRVERAAACFAEAARRFAPNREGKA